MSSSLDRPVSLHNKPLVQALSAFERNLGGRPAIREILSDLTDQDDAKPELRALAGLLADPAYSKYRLAKLCAIAKLSVGQFLRAFQDAKGARAYAEAVSVIYHRMADVAEDLTMRALPHLVDCSTCRGTGKVNRMNKHLEPVISPCRDCHGHGTVPTLPDLERQKLVLQIGGLVRPAGGTAVQVNTQVNVGEAGPLRNSVAFREATDRLLFPGRTRALPAPEPVDAEVVEEP